MKGPSREEYLGIFANDVQVKKDLKAMYKGEQCH